MSKIKFKIRDSEPQKTDEPVETWLEIDSAGLVLRMRSGAGKHTILRITESGKLIRARCIGDGIGLHLDGTGTIIEA